MKRLPDLYLQKESVSGEFVEIISRGLCNHPVAVLVAGHSKGDGRMFKCVPQQGELSMIEATAVMQKCLHLCQILGLVPDILMELRNGLRYDFKLVEEEVIKVVLVSFGVEKSPVIF